MVKGELERRYKVYSNDLDVLRPRAVNISKLLVFRLITMHLITTLLFQVEWLPYERAEVEDLGLPEIVQADRLIWRANAPLIFYYVVEHHQPRRCCRQFGRKQDFPLPPLDHTSSKRLHK